MYNIMERYLENIFEISILLLEINVLVIATAYNFLINFSVLLKDIMEIFSL